MSQAASQAWAFYREVAKSRTVWTLRDDDGYPAPKTSSKVGRHLAAGLSIKSGFQQNQGRKFFAFNKLFSENRPYQQPEDAGAPAQGCESAIPSICLT